MQQAPNDPISEAILSRARDGVREAQQSLQEAGQYLESGEYLAAIGALAGLDERVRYVSTILTVLRDLKEKGGGTG